MTLDFVRDNFIIGQKSPDISPQFVFYKRGFRLGGSATPSWKDVVISGIGSLTLVNAKANSLSSLKLFGGTKQLPETYIDSVTLEGKCEQGNLPEGYTQVEYLESSGTQYFNSGVMPNQDTSVEMKAQLFNSSTMRFFAAYATAGGTPYYGVGFSTSGKWVNQTKTSNQVTALNSDTNLHTIYKNKNILYIDGTQIDDSGSGDFTLNYPIYLLAANVGGSTSFISAGKIYYTKIWDNNTLIRNFIPCRRNSDSELGMFDTVNNQFFTNAGTGEFTAGPAITTPTPDNPIDIVCNNGAIKYSANMANVNAQTALIGYYISNTGVVTADVGNWIYQDYIPVKPSTTYTLSISSPCYYATISEYSTADDSGFITRNAKANPVTFITITTSSSTNYIRFGTNINRLTVTLDEVLAINWMLNQGDSMAYKPYVEGGIYYDGTVETATDNEGNVATAQPLLSAGDYKDTQEVLSGAVTRNVGIKVLNGTEDWTTDTYGGYRRYYMAGVAKQEFSTVFCTHYSSSVEGGTGIRQSNCYISGSGAMVIYISADQTFTTVEEFNAWAASQYSAGTPVIVVYPTSSAITETVSGQQLNKEPVTVTGSLTGLVANVVSSSHTTPTPTQPLDIVANNGVMKYGQYGKNLFDKNSSLVNGYINSSGTVISSGALKISPFIEIKPNTIYTISGTGDVKALSYDRYAYTYTAEQTPIAQVPSQTGGASATFTTAQNAKYIRIQMTTDAVNTCQLELGSTATPYEPYHFGLHYDGTVETVEVTGKNIYDFVNNNALFNSNNGNGWWLDVSNSKIAIGSSANNTTWGIPCKPNTTYTASIPANLAYSGLLRIACGTMADLSFVNGSTSQSVYIVAGEVSGNYRTATITTGNNATYIFVQIGSAGYYDGTIRNATQLELGSTATTYEPYFNGGTATAQPLLKVSDYQDVQSVLDGGITRNVGVKVLTGTEDGWSRNSDRASLLIPDILNGSNSWMPICTHYKAYHGGTSLANMDDNSCKITSGGKSLLIKDTTHNTSLTDFTDYIKAQYNAGFPVILVYPLATPTTESVTGQSLTIQAGTNIVEITQASIDNLELEVSYKAGVEVTVEEIEAVNNDESVEVTING